MPVSNDEITAFLSALSKACGSIEIVKKRLNLCLQLDSYEEGVKIVDLFKQIYPADFELSFDKAKSGVRQGAQVCVLQVPSGFSKQALQDFGLMEVNADEYMSFIEGVPQDLVRTEKCKLAYFKGLFLGCGSVYVPSGANQAEKRDGYHFELQLDDDLFADDVMELLSDLRINTRMSERGEHKLLYVKDKDEIVKILAKLDIKFDIATTSSARPAHAFAKRILPMKNFDFAPYDIVINTVPSPIVSDKQLMSMQSSCVYIDLASQCAINLEYAKYLGIDADIYPALPAKTCPYSAAKAMYDFISEVKK